MKVNNNGISKTGSTPAQPLAGAAPAPRESTTEALAQEGAAYTPSAEWLRLVDLAKQEPEVRPGRVRAAAQRLQKGDYLSEESAEATADAMLHPVD